MDTSALYDLFFAPPQKGAHQKPKPTIRSFFNRYALLETRSILWKLLQRVDKNAIEDYDSGSLAAFFEQFGPMLAATYVAVGSPTNQSEDIPVVDPTCISGSLSTKVDKTPKLEIILDIIRTIAEPEKVFLIEAHSINGLSSVVFDLFVLLPPNATQPPQQYADLIEAACKDTCPVIVSVHKADVVYSMIKEGHIFFSAVCRPQYMIYDHSQTELPVNGNYGLKKIKNKARRAFVKRFSKASGFLDGARFFCNSSQKELAAFMLHQAIEQAIIALVYSLTGTNLISHNLTRLLQFSKRCTYKLESVFDKGEPEEKALFTLLSKAYTTARYYNYSINDLQLFKMEKLVTAFLATVEDSFYDELYRLNEKHKQTINYNTQNPIP